MINAIQTALSGLAAAAKKVEATASNVANLTTVGSIDDPDNAPYTPLTTKQTALADSNGNGLGVKAEFFSKDPAFIATYSPDSPFANGDGIIGVPNVDLAEEAVNLSLAKHAYKANASVIKTANEMEDELLNIFDKRV